MGQQSDRYTNPALETHHKSYFISEAALLWCNVPKEEILDITKQSNLLTPYPDSPGEIWMNYNIPCLKDATQTITKAIDDGELPWELDHSMTTPIDGGHRLPVRKRISHQELKKWMEKKFSDEKPAFLFSDTESNTNSGISAEAYRILEAERDGLERQIKKIDEDYKTLLGEKETIKSELDSLMDEVADAGELKKLERRSYLNMIAVFLKIVSGDFPEAYKHLPYQKESTLINDIVCKYYVDDGGKYPGLSLRNLPKRFGEARESFKLANSRIRTKSPRLQK